MKMRWERVTKKMALSVPDFRRPSCIDCEHEDVLTYLDEEPFDGWAFGADSDPGWFLYCGKHAESRRNESSPTPMTHTQTGSER